MTEYSPEIPLVIKACLVRQVQVYPYELPLIIERAERYIVPYETMIDTDFDLALYIKAIQYNGDEANGYNGWVKGHERLKKLGFIEEVEDVGHRRFINLKYNLLHKEYIG